MCISGDLSGQHGGADDAGVRTEYSQLQPGQGLIIEENIFCEFLFERIQEEVAGAADAAAQDNDLRIQKINHISDSLAQVGDITAVKLHGKGIICPGGVNDGTRPDLFRISLNSGKDGAVRMIDYGFPAYANECVGGTITLQAAMIAAGKQIAIQVQNGMAQLAADSVGAVPDASIEDDAAADACADGDKNTG